MSNTNWVEDGFPWCDTCEKPAVWSEFHGWCHATDEYPFGVPATMDDTDHEVTAKDWWNAPPRGARTDLKEKP